VSALPRIQVILGSTRDGNVGGARAIEQLRLVTIELEMAPLRHAVHILPAVLVPAIKAEEPFDLELLSSLDDKLDGAATDLVWWSQALTAARAATDAPA
jgi:NAD(P)H-dependent FMN reductase